MYNPKTRTLLKRGDNFKVINELTDERFAQLNGWLVTNKMDGTSVILSIGDNPSFHGRTANTKFSAGQSAFMEYQLRESAYCIRSQHPMYDGKQIDIYAELVGPGINGNKHNLDEFELHVFDVRIDGFWLDWGNMLSVVADAELDPVRRLGLAKLDIDDIIAIIDDRSTGLEYFEGIVARSDPYLYDNRGNRLMFKLKVSDF